MKILLITNGFPPMRWAGTETYTAGIAQELLIRGNQVNVLCAGNWEEGQDNFNGFTDDIFNSVPIRRINLNWLKSPDPSTYLYNNPEIAGYLPQYLDEFKPDLVHITSCETLSASVVDVVKEYGLPSVLTLTDFWFLCPRINLFKSSNENCDGLTTPWECLKCQLLNTKVYRWPRKLLPEGLTSWMLMKLSEHPVLTRQRGLRGFAGDMKKRKEYLSEAITKPDVRITASNFVREIYKSNLPDLSMKILPYGHDLSWVNEDSPKTKSQKLRLGFIGQIIPVKGVHILVEAINKINLVYEDRIIVYIYGNIDHDPDYKKRLGKLIGDCDNIIFRGTYLHDKSADIFSEIDFLVVPSIWYDFPLIIYEAFATKTPVIATNLGGMAEAVDHEVNGLLFECGDANDLSKQIRRLIENPGLLTKLKQGMSPVIPMKDHVDQLEIIYKGLVR